VCLLRGTDLVFKYIFLYSLNSCAWFRMIEARISTQRPGFGFGLFHIWFPVVRVILGQFFLRVFRVFLVNIISPMPIHIFNLIPFIPGQNNKAKELSKSSEISGIGWTLEGKVLSHFQSLKVSSYSFESSMSFIYVSDTRRYLRERKMNCVTACLTL